MNHHASKLNQTITINIIGIGYHTDYHHRHHGSLSQRRQTLRPDAAAGQERAAHGDISEEVMGGT